MERVRERELESEKESEKMGILWEEMGVRQVKKKTRWAYARVGLKLVPSRDGFKTLVTSSLEPIASSAHRIGW